MYVMIIRIKLIMFSCSFLYDIILNTIEKNDLSAHIIYNYFQIFARKNMNRRNI